MGNSAARKVGPTLPYAVNMNNNNNNDISNNSAAIQTLKITNRKPHGIVIYIDGSVTRDQSG